MKNKFVKSGGFSLIELMVVVAIVGILATMALPQLKGFMGRARQAEAKTNLGQVFSLEKAWIADPINSAYSANIGVLGYRADGTIRYHIGFTGAGGNTTSNTVALGSATYAGSCEPACTINDASFVAGYTATATTFTGAAIGGIGGLQADVWEVTEDQAMTNPTTGI